MLLFIKILTLSLFTILPFQLLAAATVSPKDAASIIRAAGFKGGIIVHIGATDGKTAVALRQSEATIVHGLAKTATDATRGTEYVYAQGLSGPISFAVAAERLPYVDNSINLIVATCPLRVKPAEVMRVLCPNGAVVAAAEANGKWLKSIHQPKSQVLGGFVMFRKPVPPETDVWTHFLHGPDGHVMSNDRVVAPPQHIQWIGDPQHARSHKRLTTMNVMVTNGPQLFYIVDESPAKLGEYLPGRWAVMARDSYNGVVLWRRPLSIWQPYYVKDRNSYPADLHRRLVAGKKRVFVTLSIHGPVSALDAETGRTLRTYKDTDKTEDIIFEDGILYLSINSGPTEKIDRLSMAYRHTEPHKKRLVALEADSGKMLWENAGKDTDELMPMTLAAKGKYLYIQNSKNVVCLDKATGKAVWRAARPSDYARPGWSSPNLTVLDNVVISADRQNGPGQRVGKGQFAAGGFSTGNLVAFEAKTGKKLWTAKCAEGCRAPTDVFSVGGKVWFGQSLERRVDYQRVYNLKDGKLLKEYPQAKVWPTWHHHRCYRDKATRNYILAGRTGVEFIDLKSGTVQAHDWIRGTCKLGIMPANGMLYLPPEQCGCYIESKLTGFHALAPKRPNRQPHPDEHPLVHGTAAPNPQDNGAGDWPTYRADNSRSGKARTIVGPELKPGWEAKIGGRLTQPVVSNGRIFVASIDRNTLYALDSRTGEHLWRCVAGSRIDSPPTIAKGLAIFGCRDGWVYALSTVNGKLAWRFRAAPHEQMHVCSGQLESVWPVHGSVLVRNSVVYYTAGRSSYIDGGLRVGTIDLATGRQLTTKTFYSRDPETGKTLSLYKPFPIKGKLAWAEMPGVLPDVMSAADDSIWMRGVNFDTRLNITKTFSTHLFCSAGFLDDSWWELTYWIYGKHMFGGRSGVAHSARIYPTARIMVCDKTKVYGYQDGYESVNSPYLIAWNKDAKVVNSKSSSKKKKKKTRTKVVNNWQTKIPLCAEGLVLSGDTLFMAGSPAVDRTKLVEQLSRQIVDYYDAPPIFKETEATIIGKRGGILYAAKKSNGNKLMQLKLASIPVFDGMIAANKRLYISLRNGTLVCYE